MYELLCQPILWAISFMCLKSVCLGCITLMSLLIIWEESKGTNNLGQSVPWEVIIVKAKSLELRFLGQIFVIKPWRFCVFYNFEETKMWVPFTLFVFLTKILPKSEEYSPSYDINSRDLTFSSFILEPNPIALIQRCTHSYIVKSISLLHR